MNNTLQIGALIFPKIDQTDFTGPFEVLSRLPDSTFHVLGKDTRPVRDAKGLILTPEEAMLDAPPLDLLIVPGGPGVNELMEDDAVLDWVREQAAGARYVLSVCTGALVCGAAGLLQGRQATTHWASVHLLGYFGAIPVSQRVVVDDDLITTAGVTAGFDGALTVASLLRGEQAAQVIQLALEYAPEPPFDAGTPETASDEIIEAARDALRDVIATRHAVVQRVAERLRPPA